MIDKNILINLHRLFVIIRSDIKDDSVKLMLECILTETQDLKDNNKFVDNIDRHPLLFSKYAKSLVRGNNYIEVNYDVTKVQKILISAVNEIISLYREREYQEAYDLVDTVHVFPEIDFDSKEDLSNYWKYYVMPFKKKWNNDCLFRYKKFFISE